MTAFHNCPVVAAAKRFAALSIDCDIRDPEKVRVTFRITHAGANPNALSLCFMVAILTWCHADVGWWDTDIVLCPAAAHLLAQDGAGPLLSFAAEIEDFGDAADIAGTIDELKADLAAAGVRA